MECIGLCNFAKIMLVKSERIHVIFLMRFSFKIDVFNNVLFMHGNIWTNKKVQTFMIHNLLHLI